MRWEIATAIAGAVLGINPFNQPDVEASKIATSALTSEYEKTGKLPAETPFFEGEGVKLFADADEHRGARRRRWRRRRSRAFVKAHLDRAGQAATTCASSPTCAMNAAQRGDAAGDRGTGCATARRWPPASASGPRFLHSTGQAYKGGPNSGVFLQVTCDDAKDLPVPGQKYTFGVVKAAQARGDFQVLAERGRRALRVHLGADVAAGLRRLDAAIEKSARAKRDLTEARRRQCNSA